MPTAAKLYTRDSTPRKGVIRMDPDCAICRAPASTECDCEAKRLDVAIKQAEERVMRSIYTDIRAWVRAHAQDYILDYFHQLTEKRKAAHSARLDHITAHAFHHYNARPNPMLISECEMALKRGIDDDWQASVQRYPEVLEYFFNLVEFSLPADDEPGVGGLPMGSLTSQRKPRRRGGAPRHGAYRPSMGAIAFREHEVPLPSRTPPPPERLRTPGPRDRRSGSYRPAVPHMAYGY